MHHPATQPRARRDANLPRRNGSLLTNLRVSRMAAQAIAVDQSPTCRQGSFREVKRPNADFICCRCMTLSSPRTLLSRGQASTLAVSRA